MKNTKQFLSIVAITFILAYIVIGFVRWEFDWIKHLADASMIHRFYFFLAISATVGIDYWFYKVITTKDRDESEQKSYHYDKDGNDVREQ